MSQRESGYARKERDLYETPEWVTEALLPHLPDYVRTIWEPASGYGKMADVVIKRGFDVYQTDIDQGHDFLGFQHLPIASLQWPRTPQAIITNPPFDLATPFIDQALQRVPYGFVAMLLRTDFDHAKSRTHLFRDCPAFAKKLVLMKRIVWFVEDNGKPKASPSFNHAWYIWDWKYEGPATIAYGP